MEKLEKVIVENGITYVLGEDDIYYSDLQLPEGTNYNIGKFGHMRCEYLKEFRHGYYMVNYSQVSGHVFSRNLSERVA